MCDSEERKSMVQTHKPTVAGFSAQKSATGVNKSDRAKTEVKRQVQKESQVREQQNYARMLDTRTQR